VSDICLLTEFLDDTVLKTFRHSEKPARFLSLCFGSSASPLPMDIVVICPYGAFAAMAYTMDGLLVAGH
jgi:hypothetical protein